MANCFNKDRVTLVGSTNWREYRPFGITDRDRLGHLYVVGKTGVGKSTLLLNMAIQDIERGKGCCILDPHGDLAYALLNYVPQHRINEVIYFNAADVEHSIAYNPLHAIEQKSHHLVVASLVAAFKKVWSDSWGPRLEHILRFSILTLLQRNGSTLLDVQPLLSNADFRKEILGRVTNSRILRFWYEEFDKYPAAFRAEAVAPVLNKLGLFFASEPVRGIVGRAESSFSLQGVLDSGKVLICNLSKGQIGEDACALLGSMLLTSIQTAALSRASMPEDERRPFYLYVDEMHSFVTLSFADILSEARKYGLSLFLTHQYLDQLDERIRAAIFGNVGTIISFRVGAADAEAMEQEFYPVFSQADFINLPKYSVYLKLLIDGVASKPFSAETLPLPPVMASHRDAIVHRSRQVYGTRQAAHGAAVLAETQRGDVQGSLF